MWRIVVDLDRAKAEFQAGRLKSVLIEPADEGNGWMILVRQVDGTLVKIADHSGMEKVYHTLDHATEVAKQIGFDTVQVEEHF
mgnify:CR=1 FL=1